jgi:hypothetical protein
MRSGRSFGSSIGLKFLVLNFLLYGDAVISFVDSWVAAHVRVFIV